VTSIVIAAHNEAAVIGQCLDALLNGAEPGEFDITVVANGCTDDTAAAAARRGVRVIDLPTPGKSNALNAGDAAAVGFPRIYLDADIVVSAGDIRRVVAALDDRSSGALAAVPRRRVDQRGCPLFVRAFYSINTRLPAYQNALFGRGMIALTAAGRARFDAFPEFLADDLYLDSLFAATEKRQVDEVVTTVAAPRRTRDLVRRLARVRAGNATLRAQVVLPTGLAVRKARRLSWLVDVVLPRPWLAPSAVCYVAIVFAASATARRPGREVSWGQDRSTRQDESVSPNVW
jgi:glycosyltransferase involved in cell wall biosynthesis